MNRILIFDFCNYLDYPIGGYLTFGKNMLSVFGNNLALVGITTDKQDPVGKWFKKEIEGNNFDYFAIAKYDKNETNHLIPDRLICISLYLYYKKKILSIGIKNIFIQRQEIIIATKYYPKLNICYRFPGIENPLKISKYRYSHLLSKFFDRIFFKSLLNANLLLVSSDKNGISAMLKRSRGAISSKKIVQFPTRINTAIFRPLEKATERKSLSLTQYNKVVVTTGRLTALKGWKFMIDSFIIFEGNNPNSIFILIGDGEDKELILNYISEREIQNHILLVGKQNPRTIAAYLNAADLFIMGSYYEGWPTSLVEALSCKIPLCVTEFSAARELVINGINGYIHDSRDPLEFAGLMNKSTKLILQQIDIEPYSISSMKSDLLKNWELYA